MEEIATKNYARMYSAAMDSIDALNKDPSSFDPPFDVELYRKANLDYLLLMQEEDWPEEFDLTPINEAIAANQN